MAGLPSPSEVAGNHFALYEGLYQQVDPAGTGCVGAIEAAAFLKKSGLSDAVLGKIWDLSDPNGKGFLDKNGMFVGLKLIALAQNGQNVDMTNINQQVPPPNMGPTTSSKKMSTVIDWSIKPSERNKYEEMFNSLKPTNEKLPGSTVKPVMLNSKLPLETLGKIWELSDIDKDGFLDKDEFILAMHLVYKALENIPVPSALPPDLIPVSKRKKSLPGAVPVLPDLLPGMDGGLIGHRSSTPTIDITLKNIHNKIAVPWIVNATEKAKYDDIFRKMDQDQDGFVTGPDVKDIFIQSGLSQSVLAYIWGLCDMKENGKLNSEQFALAMYLINLKLHGGDIPPVLPPEMIPPTLRPKPSSESFSLQEGVTPVVDDLLTVGNKELDIMNLEVKDLQKEKIQLEQDIAQKEADMKIRSGELKTLQNEAEALFTMLKQLEVQKREAQKRLDQLDSQVGSLKTQVEDQKKSLQEQEEALNKKRYELNDLRQEEAQLEQQVESGRSKLESLANTLQEVQAQVSQTKGKITQFKDQQMVMKETLEQFDSAISSGNIATISEHSLRAFTPASYEPEYQKLSNTAGSSPVSSLSAFSVSEGPDDFKDDPFKAKDPFSGVNGYTDTPDPFSNEDPFKGDPFKSEGVASNVSADPFGWDPFNDGFGNPSSVQEQNPTKASNPEQKVDPFENTDPFGSFPATSINSVSSDPFTAGSATQISAGSDAKFSAAADPFGADPFSPAQIAPPRPESPTPALPPKKSKAPPPRPAPPKHVGGGGKSGPTRAAPAPPLPPSVHDPFSANSAKPFISGSTKVPIQTFKTEVSNQDAFESVFGSSQKSGSFISAEQRGQDPFDPFGTAGGNDPFASSTGTHQDFANFADFEKFVPFLHETLDKPVKHNYKNMSEQEQLAWVTEESIRLEQERKNAEAQEQADLELALKLSKADIHAK
ncbi:epidermal growth factor receptor substrate 15-like 1 isoform X3 [Limulus polyphemus]|uniref:Epidermal growth factor receptor substrate 15-like 1 isoform X3 n=1 Tax=Limulus polyphemus TaxID=6850 RepID=A0ABM1SIQ2_LIMPO|nr:epidermal growth factor receptor substrate 15-like 1 isoform X3 [Limulus polyphemus]